ncbi:TonB-dependent receptor [Pseudohalocynthiibacter sp. F2068]|uniref:TonB-dependent receptor domain-containing protein n=1 Tax=Pseudohalocynthiibacter sp. F2068 TaxID=2926418 RepID=UPI001FF5756F|nr:TonB-dependent receptor [Pseudohalocynthiibacter sp. F2068]MCK0103863.1 TonB-dependent receptor [Pseudohalocynthiibacter sp. F2068]
MSKPQFMRLGATAILLSSLSTTALAQAADLPEAELILQLDPIIVQNTTAPSGPSRLVFNHRDRTLNLAADGGELLRSVPGITSGRMGGHGLEPVIRGQQQNQLNIIDAGAFTFGACPNRMDPPATTAAFNRADRVIIERGYHTVTNGPGGSGGAIVLEREAPVFDPGKPWTLSTQAGAASNSDLREGALSGALDLGSGFYLEGFTEHHEADNYVDGDGATVRSAYQQQAAGVTLGYVGERLSLAFDIERDEAEDVLFPGASMDSPSSETTVMRLRGGLEMNQDVLQRVEVNAYLGTVDHVMDNFSLRPVGMMAARTPSTSDTYGGKLEAHLDFGRTTAKIGADLQSNNRMATFYSAPAAMQAQVAAENPALARFLMWPDVTIAQYGLYGETETMLTSKTTLTLGGRYDYVSASADAANIVPGGSALSPNDFYTAQYGTTFDNNREEHNFGALARVEQKLNDNATLFVGVSRSVRTSDATERAMARNNWVGNPDIAPEKHHQFDVGVEVTRANWQVGAAAYLDQVDDYILRDAFSVPGVTTYRNIGARLVGLELDGSWQRGGLELSGDMAWTYGINLIDDRPLAQIPPLSGSVSLSYGETDWRAGARVNWADSQSRIDPSRDANATTGYATLDVFARYTLSDNAILHAGVTNLTDQTYANHLNRPNVFDPTMVQVNEPGRSVYLSVSAEF